MANSPDRPLLERLQERTTERVVQAKRGPAYNVPLAWYCKPDGEIVKLQADSTNRTYYEDKGYALLRAPEAREWEQEVRPQRLKLQKRRASLINTIRKLGNKTDTLRAMVEDTVTDETETEELEQILAEIGKVTNTPVDIYLKRAEHATEEREEREADLRGVEIGAGGPELQQKLEGKSTARPGGPRRDAMGLIQGTGYDATTGRANPA